MMLTGWPPPVEPIDAAFNDALLAVVVYDMSCDAFGPEPVGAPPERNVVVPGVAVLPAALLTFKACECAGSWFVRRVWCSPPPLCPIA